ncbi:nuclear factor of activated T-cells, cytoplasmic 1 [Lates japonicus]|uniref:Nuclear factor of activated T-cells, cytoplasmic 1 n=1 Tax=Lates japonicus TaxID=270547 RepID=A0AAD3M7I9_LATJO|nr:nuclear factor of activated T-cells, cytoplasmic 1 [Lates japonicus]
MFNRKENNSCSSKQAGSGLARRPRVEWAGDYHLSTRGGCQRPTGSPPPATSTSPQIGAARKAVAHPRGSRPNSFLQRRQRRRRGGNGEYTNSAIVRHQCLTTDLSDRHGGGESQSRHGRQSLDHPPSMSLKVEPGGEELGPDGELCHEDYPPTGLKKENYCGGFLDVPPASILLV